MEVAAAAVPTSSLRGKLELSSLEREGGGKAQGQGTEARQEDPEERGGEGTLRSQIARMRQKADLLERQTGDIRAGLDDLLNSVEHKNVELAHVEGTIRTLRSQMEDATSAGSSTTSRVRSDTSTPGIRCNSVPTNSKEMRNMRELEDEAGGPQVVRKVASSQRRTLKDGVAVDLVPATREQNFGDQPQESARPRVVRTSSAPTGTRTRHMTPRLASSRILRAPASPAVMACQEGGQRARSPSLCEWMRSRATDAQGSPQESQSRPCSRACTPSRQRPPATWPTPCASCAHPVGVPVACWLAPSFLAPQQPQMAVKTSRECYMPISVRGSVTAPLPAAWSGVPISHHGSTSLVPASPPSSASAPCSGCAGLQPPPGLANCPLTLPPVWLQPPLG